jgi:tetratricopeptide (TPR) repeat protein
MNRQTVPPPAAYMPGRLSGGEDHRLVFGICLFLAVITWIVFGQTVRFDFVSLDDVIYVYGNPVVQKGLTWEGLRWALTYGGIGHWHPLTWLTHMLDCQIYGLSPGGHHLTNVMLHTATVILLFLVLREMTGFLWRSAFVAAVFAIHPLHVESVAWISERKDVLSGFFFVLTIGAYVRYARHPFSPVRYGLVLLCFALGLLSKNMLVTTPCVLLLLDFWPLGRLAGATTETWRRLLLEKIPLLGLTVLSCVATFLVPEKIPAGTRIPLIFRLENAVASYFTYLWQMIHPVGLSCLYSYPPLPPPLWHAVLGLALLLAITGGVFAARKTRPWLAMGWFWYIGMLIPVIGIIQMSYCAHSDRYTYLSQIGIYLALTWCAADWCAKSRRRQLVLGTAAAVTLAGLMVCARAQTAVWQNGELLWRNAVACAPGDFLAHKSLGLELFNHGKVAEAVAEFRRARQLNPASRDIEYDLANALVAQDQNLDEAIADYREILQHEPDRADLPADTRNDADPAADRDSALVGDLKTRSDFVRVHCNLGIAYIHKGDLDAAIAEFQQALRLNPGELLPRNNLGYALLLRGRVDEAITQLQHVLQAAPGYAEAHHNLGDAFLKKGDEAAAITQYRQALQINPDYVAAQNDLAWELATAPAATVRDGNQALALAERASQQTGGTDPVITTTLAAACAETDHFSAAIRTAQTALTLAQAAGQTDQIMQITSQLKLYEAGRPFHREGQ